MIKEMSFGYYPHFLKIMNGPSQVGLLCFNQDHTHLQDFRAYLRHISTTEESLLEEAIKEASSFIFGTLGADTIRVDLFHFNQGEDNKLMANAFVKEALIMKKQGYKWKSMMNESDGTRFQIMQMNRPKEMAAHTAKQEPLLVKSALLLSLKNGQAS